MNQPVEKSPNVGQYVRVVSVKDIQSAGCLPVQIDRHNLALYFSDGVVYAIDNRCPHMGFPLHRGTLEDGVLTCHWHHARFDLSCGGTFDQWADDVRVYPVEVRGDDVWVDLAPHGDPLAHERFRLRHGLERNIALVTAKAVIRLLEGGVAATEPFRIGLDFGTQYRQAGWGQGLTIHTSMMNLLPTLEPDDRSRALYHGITAVAANSAGSPPRFILHPLPGSTADITTIKRWFRQFVAVRDAEGAERCIVSAVRGGASARQMADMLFTAATDHRYIEGGHVMDFTNKAFEALDHAGWDFAEPVLASLAAGYANAERMEESNAWRHPIDLVRILERSFKMFATPVAQGEARRRAIEWDMLVPVLLGDDPHAIAEALTDEVISGTSPEDLAGVVAYAAALRIAQFHTSNEFGDWDTALHTFTFANAVQLALHRAGSVELLRGVFDAAMSVYLDRFLNVPATPLPEYDGARKDPAALLRELPTLLDRQQQVDEAGAIVGQYFAGGGAVDGILAALGSGLLREDRDFHTIQAIETAFRQCSLLRDSRRRTHVLVAGARYLAAHCPTVRSQGQTFQIARRLSRGERLEESSPPTSAVS
jgi:nitrite reductase/ring-hydroxylating ferredoxin subunit